MTVHSGVLKSWVPAVPHTRCNALKSALSNRSSNDGQKAASSSGFNWHAGRHYTQHPWPVLHSCSALPRCHLSFSDRQWLNEFTLQLGRFTTALLPCEPSLIISRAVRVTRRRHVWVLAVRRQAELLSCNSLSVPTGAYPAPGSKKCECNSQICRSTVLRNILRQECTWQNYQWS